MGTGRAALLLLQLCTAGGGAVASTVQCTLCRRLSAVWVVLLWQGLTKAVGVSNFNEDRVRNAAKVLRDRGTCLSSNQVRCWSSADRTAGFHFVCSTRPQLLHRCLRCKCMEEQACMCGGVGCVLGCVLLCSYLKEREVFGYSRNILDASFQMPKFGNGRRCCLACRAGPVQSTVQAAGDQRCV